jgi:hypothetical protein
LVWESWQPSERHSNTLSSVVIICCFRPPFSCSLLSHEFPRYILDHLVRSIIGMSPRLLLYSPLPSTCLGDTMHLFFLRCTTSSSSSFFGSMAYARERIFVILCHVRRPPSLFAYQRPRRRRRRVVVQRGGGFLVHSSTCLFAMGIGLRAKGRVSEVGTVCVYV